uniref:PEP-utilising enzyme mobile domain-containing protein n=1 Tax=candidate division WOR-3 bacterium TaxID=2052148 RepID=A0A7C2K0L1_UNCW3
MERSELWEKWEKENPKVPTAIWDYAPGYELIPEVDIPIGHSWFFDGTHSCPPLEPFSLYEYWMRGCGHGLKYINTVLSVPGSYGTEGRTIDFAAYWSFYIVRDEKERRERELKMKEALKPYMEDYMGLWKKKKEELSRIYDRLINYELRTPVDYVHLHWECISSIFRVWEIHFEGMQSANLGWLYLSRELERLLGITSISEEFQRIMPGFENDVYVVERELWELSKLAVDMGIENVFKEKEEKEIKAELESSAKGKEWLKLFASFLEKRGWRSISSTTIVDPYWKEDPQMPLRKVKNFILSGEAYKPDFALDEARKKAVVQREEAVKKLLERIPENERPWIRALIGLAQMAGYYSEDHDLWCEMTHLAVLRYCYLRIGERLAKYGCIDEPEDVVFLISPEIEMCLIVPQRNDMRWITRRRKKAWKQARERFIKEGEWRPPVYTDREGGIQEALLVDLLPSDDPIFINNVVGEIARISAEEAEADIVGICGSPGIAEGRARVIMHYEDLRELQPGEILVCPMTSPEWCTAFGLAAGVIADRGGTLSHTAIIAREYGTPAITNTFVATTKIKTGDYIKMDATRGLIWIVKDK